MSAKLPVELELAALADSLSRALADVRALSGAVTAATAEELSTQLRSRLRLVSADGNRVHDAVRRALNETAPAPRIIIDGDGTSWWRQPDGSYATRAAVQHDGVRLAIPAADIRRVFGVLEEFS